MTGKARRFELESTQPRAGSVLDELTGIPPAAGAAPAPEVRPPGAARPAAGSGTASGGGKRVPIRVEVPQGLADRVRGAVAALAYREPHWSSLNAAAAAALERFVTDTEAEHNGGEPFPWEPGRQLQPGRRVGDRNG